MSNNRNSLGDNNRFKKLTKQQVKGIRSSDSGAVFIDAKKGTRSGPHKSNHFLAYENGAAFLTNKAKFPSRPRLSSLPFFSQPGVLRMSDEKKETDQRLFKEKKAKSKATIVPGQHCAFPESLFVIANGTDSASTRESSTDWSDWSEDATTLTPLVQQEEEIEKDKYDVSLIPKWK